MRKILINSRKYNTLQYISDIHLESRSEFPLLPVRSKNLALIGDIGNPFKNNYADFLKYTSDNYERVFLVAGNHEYWHHRKTHQQVDDKIHSIVQKLPNIEYLNNSQTELNNYIILGGTLWTPNNYSILHQQSLDWLQKSIENNYNKNIIVLTHYLPSFKLIVPKYQSQEYDKIRNRYASDLDHLINLPIRYWLCGHSHCTFEIKINNVFCAINAFEYSNVSNLKKEKDIVRIIDLT